MDTITITRDQFFDAVRLANDNFTKLGEKHKKTDGDEMASLMMGLQNIMFGSMISDVLFSDTKSEV